MGHLTYRYTVVVVSSGKETIIVDDIFDIIQQVRDTGIHLKVLVLVLVLIDEEPKSSRGPQKRNERQVGGERTHTCHKATTCLLHNANSKSTNKKSLAKLLFKEKSERTFRPSEHCCFSHSAYWLPTPEKTTLHGGG